MKFTLDVKPRTKKNHSRLVTLKTGRQLMLPSKQYAEFEREVLSQTAYMFKDLEPIDTPINLKCVFYKEKNYRSDLIGYLQAIQDALVKAGILLDDNSRIICSTDGSRIDVDREHPRIEIEITPKHDSSPENES